MSERDEVLKEASKIAHDHHVRWADERDRSLRGSRRYAEAQAACSATALVWHDINALLPREANSVAVASLHEGEAER
jgi:hypothetical protein